MSVCVPVLKRYDLLREMLLSLNVSTRVPDQVCIIDNGRDAHALEAAVDGVSAHMSICVHVPTKAMGVAESWNWFINHVPEERIITNDDIVFASESIAAMVAQRELFVSCTFGFSCFLIRDELIDVVGLFDETLSPSYAYFEDMDYLRRMRMAHVVDKVVECGVAHRQSATSEKFTEREWAEHHKKFLLAQSNYEKKWAGKPSWDELAAIGGEGAHQ